MSQKYKRRGQNSTDVTLHKKSYCEMTHKKSYSDNQTCDSDKKTELFFVLLLWLLTLLGAVLIIMLGCISRDYYLCDWNYLVHRFPDSFFIYTFIPILIAIVLNHNSGLIWLKIMKWFLPISMILLFIKPDLFLLAISLSVAILIYAIKKSG
jgi:hypothetical protein